MNEKRPQGRPRLYDDPRVFDIAVDSHIAYCVANAVPITWTGLALALGFSSRQSIDEYLNYPGFSYSVKRAKLLVENAYEKDLHSGKPVGAIFALKNFGWRDKQELELGGSEEFLAALRETTRRVMVDGDGSGE